MGEAGKVMIEAVEDRGEDYSGDFLAEVEARVEEGEWVTMCTQCGVCSGSCPLGPDWEHPPHRIFQLIRANRRDEVLGSPSVWMCTSCHACVVRCPRGVPVAHVMHGLAHYAVRRGLAPADPPTRRLAERFWENVVRTGRVNEPRLALSLLLANGLAEGVRRTLRSRDAGLGLLKAGRMSRLAAVAGDGVKDPAELRAILEKARAIELAKAAALED